MVNCLPGGARHVRGDLLTPRNVSRTASQMVTLEDWELAKTMFATSKAVMDDLQEYGQEKAQDEADRSADAYANKARKAYLAEKNADQDVHRIAVLIYTHAADREVLTVGAHRKLLAGRDKPLFSEALSYAVNEKWLTVVDNKVATSITTPPE